MSDLTNRNHKLQQVIEETGADSIGTIATAAGMLSRNSTSQTLKHLAGMSTHGVSLAERWRTMEREHSELLLRQKQHAAELEQLR